MSQISHPANAFAAIFHRHGSPERVLELNEQPVRDPGPGEILVRLLRASVNPADLNVLEGTYAKLPALPATPGMEGVGEVSALGEGVTTFHPGQLILLPLGEGHWREWWTGPVEGCLAVPEGVPVEVAGSLRVNPATAWRMLHDFVKLEPGEWVLQNAANSAVGRCVIQIARHFGWKTINLVRRPELVEELLALGADAVVLDNAQAKDRIREVTGNAPIRLALNTVGGENAFRMISSLATGGTLVTYGAMNRQPVKVSNGALIFKDVSLRGFWVTRWYEKASSEEKTALLEEMAVLVRAGLLHPQVDAVFPLSEIKEAIKRASEGRRNGKVLLDCSAPALD